MLLLTIKTGNYAWQLMFQSEHKSTRPLQEPMKYLQIKFVADQEDTVELPCHTPYISHEDIFFTKEQVTEILTLMVASEFQGSTSNGSINK